MMIFTPKGSKIDPKSIKNRPWKPSRALLRPRARPEAPKAHKDSPFGEALGGPRAPKIDPETPQKDPKGFQNPKKVVFRSDLLQTLFLNAF